MKKVREYLKMADVFKGSVFYCDKAKFLADADGYCGELRERNFTLYATHAINSHDALVAQRDELLAALEDLKREVILSDVNMDYIESHFRHWLDKASLAIDKAKGDTA